MDTSDKTIKTLVEQLQQNENIAQNSAKVREEFKLSKEEMDDFIRNNSAVLFKESIETIRSLRDVVVSTGDAEQMASLAGLISAATGAMEVLNKMSLQHKKSETSLKSVQMQIDSREKLKLQEGPENTTNINVVIGTREDIINQFIEAANKGKKQIEENEEEIKTIDVD